ncbi:MAG: hypothetical protein KGJ08_09910, partial [Gammaproteobacteria bacterium]|nr:hypothetical protein [Gammaproteobacteria bacterium]
YRLALRLDPYNALAHQWYAKYFWLTGHAPQALKYMRTADELDPQSSVVKANLGRALTYTGAYHSGEKQLLADIAASPQLGLGYEYLAETHLAMKEYRQALDDVKAAMKATATYPDSLLLMESGLAELGLGHKNLARQYLSTLLRREPEEHISGVLTAELYWSLGDKDHSFTELQRAAKEHDQNLMIVAGPDWAGVRADPRFAQIRALMNLPAAEAPYAAAVGLHTQP